MPTVIPAAAWKPEWHIELSEAEENQKALTLDSLKTTHPIHVIVNTPEDVDCLVDGLAHVRTVFGLSNA